jgi:serine/threonine-protein kinase
MGEVWRAEHVVLGSPMAIKVIVDAGFDESNPLREELVTRFFREAQAAAALRSPHVVQILDHGVDGVPYIAMELLEGETLEERLDRVLVLPPLQTVEIVTHIARAISKAHDVGIVHRDLKPGNVFIVRNDDEEIAKVLDFGIAKITPAAGFEEGGNVATRTGSVVGTPCYMSPEQALGNKTIDSRSDLWSLAVIAFECVVGQRPFDSEALGDLIVAICARPIPVPSKLGRVPEGFDAWWAKAACRDPDGRFQTAKELAEALRVVLAPETISYRARLAAPSHPNIRVTQPPESSSDRGSDEFAKTTPHNQATHAGVVSAITSSPKGRRRKPMLLIGAASFLVTAGALVAVLASRGSNPTLDDTSASASAQATTALAPGAGEPSGGAATVSGEPAPTTTAQASAAPDSTPREPGDTGPAVSPSSSSQAGAVPSGSAKASTPSAPGTWKKPPTRPTSTRPPDRLGF